MFQVCLSQAEAESGWLIKVLKADGGKKFALYKLWTFCEKRNILIKYAGLYIYKKNELVEQST